MSQRLKAYLELVRVFLTPTAIADSFAGFIIAAAPTAWNDLNSGRLLAVMAASIAAYWLGMAANDLCDRARDVRLAPQKPLPQGRLSPGAVTILCLLLGSVVIGIAMFLQTPWVALLLLLTVLAYDTGAKNIPLLGNVVMGACRGLNFLWGAAGSVGEGQLVEEPRWLLAAGVLTVFVAGVTAVSRLEDAPFSARALRWRALPLLAIPLLLVALAWFEPAAHVNALLLGGILVLALRGAIRHGQGPQPRFHGAQIFVRQALSGIFFVDAGLLAALLGEPHLATTRRLAMLFLLVLFLWAWWWKKAWLRRGSSGS